MFRFTSKCPSSSRAGLSSTFTYDDLNRLKSLSGYQYQLGPTGNRTSATEPFNRALNWTYDGIYRLTQETINTHQGTAILQVMVRSTWLYQFSQAQQAQIKLAILGKSREEATTLLLHMPGVQTVSISTRNGDALPTDVQRIHLNFVILT